MCANLLHIYGKEIVHILVGPDRVDFGVHKDLLCHYPPHYFKSAFKTGGFIEASAEVMSLPEECPEMFKLFNHWLYYQTL